MYMIRGVIVAILLPPISVAFGVKLLGFVPPYRYITVCDVRGAVISFSPALEADTICDVFE